MNKSEKHVYNPMRITCCWVFIALVITAIVAAFSPDGLLLWLALGFVLFAPVAMLIDEMIRGIS
jgi:hypothetical protein